jgi:hypothetical protein
MVSKLQDAPGCSPACIPWFVIFFAIIVAIAAILAPVGWPNIDNYTCLLTLHVALWRSQYQAITGPLQGIRRSCKAPDCHCHNSTQEYHRLHCPPCRQHQKWKNLLVNDTQECNKGQNWSCLHIFCLPDALGQSRDPSLPHPSPSSIVMSFHCLHCPACKHQKRKTLTDIIIHECNSDHLKSRLQNFYPHGVWQWSTELSKSNGQERWAAVDDGGVRIKGTRDLHRAAISKRHLKNLHPHDVQLWSAKLGKYNGRERWAAIVNGGVKIKGTRALQ